MKNLEQIRAAHAWGPSRTLDKAAVNKLPALILSNGLLATAAFCRKESTGNNRDGMGQAFEATAKHLALRGLVGASVNSIDGLIQDLVARNSMELQRATTEALAFIGYLRRFAEKSDKS